jgi:hypothetical protein
MVGSVAVWSALSGEGAGEGGEARNAPARHATRREMLADTVFFSARAGENMAMGP